MADAVDLSELLALVNDLLAAAEETDETIMLHLRNLGNFTMAMARAELEDVKFTGALDSSFVVEADKRALEVSIFPQVEHTVFVRRGTKPHWAPIGPLKLWAQVKLGDKNLAYPVQRSIATRGTSVESLRKRGTMGNPWPERVVQRSDFNQAVEKTMKDIARDIEVDIVKS